MAVLRAYLAIAFTGAVGGVLVCFVVRALAGPRGPEQVLTIRRGAGLYELAMHPWSPLWFGLVMAVIAIGVTAVNSNRGRGH